MKKYLILGLLLLLPQAALASTGDTFAMLIEPYEDVRQALLHDTSDGVAEKAVKIRDVAKEHAADDGLLAKISDAAGKLAEASDLDNAREAFYEISKLMVQYRSKAGGDGLPVVVYCSMAKKSWLQPEGEIGNPYYGQSMARCGEVVEK